jgi:hypothetical protein
MNTLETSSTRTNQHNQRRSERFVPSQPLQPYFSTRPVQTKYTLMPIVDQRQVSNVPVIQRPVYQPEIIFNPGSSSPWSGFSTNINKESELRNQIYALQDCSQAVYVPSSYSDLYQINWKQQPNIQQPFTDLFNKQTFDKFNPNPDSEVVGFALFNNSTRHQNKDVKC